MRRQKAGCHKYVRVNHLAYTRLYMFLAAEIKWKRLF